MIPHGSIPHGTIPHGRIPHGRIPQGRTRVMLRKPTDKMQRRGLNQIIRLGTLLPQRFYHRPNVSFVEKIKLTTNLERKITLCRRQTEVYLQKNLSLTTLPGTLSPLKFCRRSLSVVQVEKLMNLNPTILRGTLLLRRFYRRRRVIMEKLMNLNPTILRGTL